jgi:Protein of unknown function (DUF3810)
VLLVAAAVALAWAPMDPVWVERVYSRAWYLTLQPIVTSISSLAPIALLDVWIVCALLALLWSGWRVSRAPSGTRVRAAAGALVRGVVVASAVYLAFLACWGLNYRRQPITAGLDFDAARVTAAEVDEASRRAVTEINRLHQNAHADVRTSPTLAAMRVRLAPAFGDAQRALGRGRPATAGRPKISMLSPFFRWASVDGMMNPWGLEVIVNPDVLPVEQPFVIAHEWGHLAGWARESEASYVGWLTCRAGDAAAQYSGWLAFYWHLRGALPRERLTTIESGLAAGPRRDLAAIAARLQRAQRLVQQASWRTYDQFLKANRVDQGVKNYDEVVTLILGTAADADGRPRRR